MHNESADKAVFFAITGRIKGVKLKLNSNLSCLRAEAAASLGKHPLLYINIHATHHSLNRTT